MRFQSKAPGTLLTHKDAVTIYREYEYNLTRAAYWVTKNMAHPFALTADDGWYFLECLSRAALDLEEAPEALEEALGLCERTDTLSSLFVAHYLFRSIRSLERVVALLEWSSGSSGSITWGHLETKPLPKWPPSPALLKKWRLAPSEGRPGNARPR